MRLSEPNNAWPLSDPASVADARRALGDALTSYVLDTMDAALEEAESYESAADLEAARELEEWGCNPFEEGR
jgi:hypothetical protein